MYLLPEESQVRNAFLRVFGSEDGRLVYLAILAQLGVARGEDVPGIQNVLRLIERGMSVPNSKQSDI